MALVIGIMTAVDDTLVAVITFVIARGHLFDDCGVLDEGFEHLPAPFAVLLITGDAVHVEKGFDCLGSLEIMGVLGMYLNVGFPYIFIL